MLTDKEQSRQIKRLFVTHVVEKLCLWNSRKNPAIFFTGLLGLLVAVAVPADSPPWEIWNDLNLLAEVHPGQRVLLRGSRCPSGCRYDRHSEGDWRYIRHDGDEGVIFEEAGAGAITRIWMTMGQGVSQPLDPSVRLRLYIDGAEEPLLDIPLPDLFNGSTPPFRPPLAGDRESSSGGNFSYVPIPYRKGCRVTLVGAEKARIWFQFGFHRLAEPGEVVSFSLDDDLSTWETLLGNVAQDPWVLTGDLTGSVTVKDDVVLAPGASKRLVDLAGPDSITALRFWLPEAAWPSIELQLVFDGNQRVHLPLSDFFAIGRAGSEGTRSLLLGTSEDGGLYSYFPMPFFEHAEVTLTNQAASGSAPVSIAFDLRHANQEPSPGSALFGAQRWFNDETHIGVDIPLLKLSGEGKWVGLFADLGSVNSSRRDYLEGDERVFLDGSNHPEVYGTGTEDIFNGGFYFDQGPFRQGLHGSPYHHILENGEDVTAAYRLMLTDGISFASSIRAGLEGGPTSNRSLRARTVAYYYLRSAPGLWLSDVLDLGDPASRAEHDYTTSEPHQFLPLEGLFEGEPAMAMNATGVYRPPGMAHFKLRAAPGSRRLRLKRRLDANWAGQEAEIRIDGNLVGRFPPEDQNSDRRWREISIDLPMTTVNANGELEVTITALPPPETAPLEDPMFTAFTYELWTDENERHSSSPFKINSGLNDAWYDRNTDGQGFFITVFPDLGYVSLAWFTYDTKLPEEDAQANLGDPGHRWITAIGPIVGNQVAMDIDMTSGGIFDSFTEITHTDPPGSNGTLILTFDSCNSGTVEYDIPSINRQGTVPIQRVANDNIVLCEALNTD